MPEGDTRGSNTEGEGEERGRRGMIEELPLLNRGNIKKI